MAVKDAGKSLSIKTYLLGEELVAEIADTGCGMTDEQLNRACDPFFSTKENGTGLGLSIVNSIMKEHCGQLKIESATGKGTAIGLCFKAD